MKSLLAGFAGLVRSRRARERREQELRAYFGVRHVFLVSSGKAALAVILSALHALRPEKKTVVAPAYTCWSVPSAIVKAGLTTAPCDMDAGRFDYDYELLPEAISGDTLCVIAGNLFGIPSDIDRIVALGREKGVFVVEDAAQAMGSVSRKRKVGAIADVGFFSLGRGKNVTSGSGGIIVTNSDAIADAISAAYQTLGEPGFLENLAALAEALLLTVFIRPWLYWLPAGLPFLKLGETFFYRDFPVRRLSGMKAGLLENWEESLERQGRERKANSAAYAGALNALFPSIGPADEACLRFPVLAHDRNARDAVLAESAKRGLGASRMYPGPLNRIGEIRGSFPGKAYPAAERMADRLFTLPTHSLVRPADREAVCAAVKRIAGATQERAPGSGHRRKGEQNGAAAACERSL